MRKLFKSVLIPMLVATFAGKAQESTNVVRIFDEVVFYDGYRLDNNPDKDLEDGVLRHSCSLYATRLSDEQLDAIGEQLNVNVTVQACCDNYDRIGNINVAFVEKGSDSYQPSETPRIEIGRFITPFMDKNKSPREVPYSYQMDYLGVLLRDKALRERYDIWLEFELFGIPYSANQQIKGCEGRSDVFAGTLEFETSEPGGATEGNVVIPVVIKKPEYMGNNLNNYNEAATDELGKTVKTYTFESPENMYDSQIVLITSNHGANMNGEEYNRRWHFVYLDDELVLSYRPGRDSCEPFREYNTQSNGIYGFSKKSDALWQSFSNWCPGDVIDNRIISVDNLKKGEHKIRIEVPDAVFADGQGDIPVSIYVHGNKNENPNGIKEILAEENLPVRISTQNGIVTIISSADIEKVEIYSMAGEKIHSQTGGEAIDLGKRKGVFIVCIEMFDGTAYSGKIIN